MKYLITEEQLGGIADGIQRLLTNLLKDKKYISKVTAEPIADENYEDDESIEIYLVFDMDKLLGVNDTNKHILRVRAQRIARDYVEKFFPNIEFGVYTRAKSNRN
jgi:hypothetical protein